MPRRNTKISQSKKKVLTDKFGATVRGDTTKKEIALVFTGDLFGDGGSSILKTLATEKIKASFFLTGNFYRNPDFRPLIQKLKRSNHYLGAHSNTHLLYCDWTKRDSLLVTRKQFYEDIDGNYAEMQKFGIMKTDSPYFLPPYEWYNDSIVHWTKELNLTLVNFTAGTLSHADYTTPEVKNYRTSDVIFNSIATFENKNQMNGFILLIHIGTDPKRIDKFYNRLPELIQNLKNKNYTFVKIDELLN